jgi:hypothetical protein
MLTCFRQAHASMAAFEQGEADLVFENADASTDCRLLQVQRNGGLMETAFSAAASTLRRCCRTTLDAAGLVMLRVCDSYHVNSAVPPQSSPAYGGG